MPNEPDDPLEIAQRFATALDHDDFAAAARLLTEDCTYFMRDEQIRGPNEIVESYRSNSIWAKQTFEQVGYESEVEASGDGGAAITFVDILNHRGLAHTHRCRQVLSIDDGGRITSITHVDLPCERERLDAFFARAGVARPET